MSKPLVQERFNPTRLPGLSLWLDAQATTTISSTTSTGVTAWADRSGAGNNLNTSSFYVPGCTLWLDASDPNATGVPAANGATITTWKDKSGLGSNATAATAAPTTTTYTGPLNVNSVFSIDRSSVITVTVIGGGGGGGGYGGAGFGGGMSGGSGGNGAVATYTFPGVFPSGTLIGYFVGGGGYGGGVGGFGDGGDGGGGGTNSYVTIGSTTVYAGGGGGGGGGGSYTSGTAGSSGNGNNGGNGGAGGSSGNSGGSGQNGSISSLGIVGTRVGAYGNGGGANAAGNPGLVVITITDIYPTINSTGLNSRPTMNFNGGSWFTGSTTNTGTTATIFMVMQQPASTTTINTPYTRVLSMAPVGGSDYLNGSIYTKGLLVEFVSGNVYAWRASVVSSTQPVNTPYIFDYQLDGTNAFSYLNGLSQGSFASTDTFSIGTYRIGGAVQTQGAPQYTGYVSEVLVFNTAITTTQRQQIECYLSKKWGVALSYTPPVFVPTFSSFNNSPIISNTLTNQPSIYFSTSGAQMVSTIFSGLISSKSIFMAYQCPTATSTMRFSIGSDISGQAFGLAQSNGLVYSPYQYGYGDTSWTLNANTYPLPNVLSAVFDASRIAIRGDHNFNAFFDFRETAIISSVQNTPYVLGKSTNSSSVFTSSNFHVCEIIAYNRALGATDRQMVEGYLAWKWGMTTQLPNGHPYQTFPPSGEQVVNATTPYNVFTGLVSWIDMADSTSYTLSGTNLKTLTDKVSGGGTFTISGNSNALAMTSIGDLPALNFAGNATGILSSSSPSFLTRALTVTPQGCAFAVFTPPLTQVAASKLGLLGWGAPGNTQNNPVLGFTSQSSVSLQSYNTGGTFYGPQLTLTPGSPTILFWAWYGGNMFYLSSNGSPVLSSPQTAGFYTNTSTNNQFYIGNDGGYGASFKLGELCIYNSYLETPFRNMVEGYLAWKWGLQKNLAAVHPYTLSAPSLQTLTEVDAISKPADISGLTLWLDAADTTTFASSTLVFDKSPISNNLSGTFIYSKFGNPARPSIYFAPATSATTIYNSGADTKQFSAFLVASIPTLSYLLVSTGQLTTGTAGVAGQTFGFYASNGSASVFSPYVFAGTNATNNTVGNYSTISGQTFELFATINGTTLSGNMNFASPLSNVTNTANAITATPWVFGNSSGDTSSKSFHVHEFITYNRPITTIERQFIEGYLYWKWLV